MSEPSEEQIRAFEEQLKRLREAEPGAVTSNPGGALGDDSVAVREPWNACCSPSRMIEKPQSRIPRFGYRHMAMPK